MYPCQSYSNFFQWTFLLFFFFIFLFVGTQHYELIRVVTDYCAAREESSLTSLMIAIHGAPFEGNIEALLLILQKLDTVHIDVTKYDRVLQRAVADVDKLVALNAVRNCSLFWTILFLVLSDFWNLFLFSISFTSR